MNSQESLPTKNNLFNAKKTLSLANLGFELMDRKRKLLINESKKLKGRTKELQDKLAAAYKKAYIEIQIANIDNGIGLVKTLSEISPIDNSIDLKLKSFMGIELPIIKHKNKLNYPTYSFSATKESIDKASIEFNNVKQIILELAEVENTAYRLEYNINKISKRANALKNITIPKYTSLIKRITALLEEKEREEFTRLKSIKKKLSAN